MLFRNPGSFIHLSAVYFKCHIMAAQKLNYEYFYKLKIRISLVTCKRELTHDVTVVLCLNALHCTNLHINTLKPVS